MRHITLIIAVLALAAAAPAIAGKGGHANGGNGNTDNGSTNGGSGNGSRDSGGTCSFAGNVVVASGLPTDTLINFMITDSSGSRGWVLGYTSTGSWSVSVNSPSGPTTYEFASRTYGPNGTKYDVYASCSS